MISISRFIKTILMKKINRNNFTLVSLKSNTHKDAIFKISLPLTFNKIFQIVKYQHASFLVLN